MKLSTEKQFFSNDEVKDTFYANVRDKEHHQETRKFVEELWQMYKPYAEPDFLENAKNKDGFHARTWEMYLGCVFLKHGLNLQKKTKIKGPDLHLLWNNHSIWVEATAPESGSGGNKVPEYRFNEVSDQPSEQIILRFTSAIQEKFKNFKSYRSKGIINADDFYIIAINGGSIRYSSGAPTLPYVVLSVLPFGNLVFALDKESGKLVNSFHQYRDAVTTAKGSPVPTDIFMNKDYAGISGVLYSHMNVVNRPNQIGIEVNIVHNPLAPNKLPLGIFPFGTEWWVEDDVLKKRVIGSENLK